MNIISMIFYFIYDCLFSRLPDNFEQIFSQVENFAPTEIQRDKSIEFIKDAHLQGDHVFFDFDEAEFARAHPGWLDN